MGICDSCNSGKSEFKQIKDIQRNKNYEISDLCILENKSHDELKTNNNYPMLNNYKRSSIKKSKMNQSKSEISSKKADEEIIVKGEINKKCFNKEKDFNNKSFLRTIKNNGGIIIKDNSQKNNNYKTIPCIDFDKDTISEIKSEKSYDILSQNSIYNYINELNMDKLCKNQNKYKIEQNINYDKKSNHTNKISRSNTYLNNYFNNKLNNADIRHNNTFKNKDHNLTILNKTTISNGAYEKRSLYSNYNNMTNNSTSGDLMGSFISIPKNDERVPESDLKVYNTFEDFISNLSSE